MKDEKNIIIIGSRGYQYAYGGWETFVTQFIKNNHDSRYHFFVPSLTHDKTLDGKIKMEDKVVCPSIYVPKKGFITMFLFTIKATRYFLKYIKEKHLKNAIVLELGCKVGPFFPFWHRKLRKMGAYLIINPDGLEWKREKWSWWIQKCFKMSERFCVHYSDYCVCDSKSIEIYIKKEYPSFHTPTKFIAFGAYLNRHPKKTKIVEELFSKWNIKEKNYYLIVGRFTPENNYELMIREFMNSPTKKDLVIISNVEENQFFNHLKESTHFEEDKRIKFVGSLYEEESLLYVRKNAYAYLHGHSVGGTNPSLLEALSITDVNLLFDVCYNKEVGEDACLYFSKEKDSLKKLILEVEKWDDSKFLEYGKKAKERIKKDYTWEIIVNRYKEVFETLWHS